jgi:hypothetical protein
LVTTALAVRREHPHELVQHGMHGAGVRPEVPSGEGLDRAQRGQVLPRVPTLRVRDRHAAHPLGDRERGLDQGHGQANRRRHEDRREGAEQLPVHRDPGRGELAGLPVDLLPVAQRVGDRHVLGVGDVVGDPAALERGEPGGGARGEQRARVRRSVPHLDRCAHGLVQLAASGRAVGDQRVSVEAGRIRRERPVDAGELEQPGVRVDRDRENPGIRLVLQAREQGQHLGVAPDAAARLDERLPGHGGDGEQFRDRRLARRPRGHCVTPVSVTPVSSPLCPDRALTSVGTPSCRP